jgi:sarcosine oxidase subunit alpha
LSLGGTSTALVDADAAARWAPLRARFEKVRGAIRVRLRTTAAALYGDDLLVVGEEGAEVVHARALVLAPGAHDGALAFEGNDVPGVMSARAGAWLWARGVAVGERVAVVVDPASDGAVGEGFARAVASAERVEIVRGTPVRANGSARVKSVDVVVDGQERRIKCDALLLDAPRAPAYELCEQAGAVLDHQPRGFVPRVDRGKIRDGVFALGEVTGASFDVGTFEAQAEEIAARL